MTGTLTWLGLLCALLAAGGCRRAETDYDPATDFSQYHTYAWAPAAEGLVTPSERDFPGLIAALCAAADARLSAVGLHPVAPARADLHLQLHLELSPYHIEPPSANDAGRSDVPSRRLGPLVVAPYSVTQVEDSELNRELEEGALLLNMQDARTGELVWQSWLHRVIDVENLRASEWRREPDAAERRYRDRVAKKAVATLLADFPLAGATAGHRELQPSRPAEGAP